MRTTVKAMLGTVSDGVGRKPLPPATPLPQRPATPPEQPQPRHPSPGPLSPDWFMSYGTPGGEAALPQDERVEHQGSRDSIFWGGKWI